MAVQNILFTLRLALMATVSVVPAFLAADTIPTYIFQIDGDQRVILDDAVRLYPDTSSALTIEEILAGRGPAFVKRDALSFGVDSYNLWYRLRASNPTNRQVSKVVFVSLSILEGDVYVTDGGRIISEAKTGSLTPPGEKAIYSQKNYLKLEIPPGSTRTLYLRTNKGNNFLSCCPNLMIANSPRWMRARLFRRGVGRFFYLGIMVLIGVISLFSYYLFRKSIFLSFGALMILFGGYFVVQTANQAPLFPGGTSVATDTWIRLILAGIHLMFFLFTVSYLKLSEALPRIFQVYRILTFLLVSELLFLSVLGQLSEGFNQASRLFSLAWVLFTFYLVVKLAIYGSKAARVLALSFFLLMIGAIVDLAAILPYFHNNVLVSNSLQISTVFFAGIIFRELLAGFSELRRQKEQLAETATLKSRFFANITHEFRTPLTLMLAPLRQVINQTEDTESIQLLELAERNAERQLELVDQLLDLAQLDAKALRLQAARADFSAYLQRTVAAYESLAVQQDIQLLLDLPEMPVTLYFDEEKTDRIILNLLSNAFKFTPVGGTIKVAMTQDAKEVEIAISDTGRGITPELLPHIFDRFFLAGNSKTDTKGTGIGLALVREMVLLHHGRVRVESQVGEGSTITICFPLGREHLQPEDLFKSPLSSTEFRRNRSSITLNEASSAASGRTLEPASSAAAGTHSSVLLIEDNAEMRAFITQMLAPTYRVITAVNGVEGVRLALDSPPDLIVSDLMMPEKDGYQVCRELKADLRTSHVPIILLTARASRDARVIGLDEGADDYLTKPFDARELLARAANLIRSRQILRERFASSIFVKPSELAVTTLDQDFLTRALEHVETHLNDANLSVDQLAEVLNTSRTQLNSKLRALVNQSSNQFIQSVRLQRAAQLLRQENTTAKEVAYTCGFSSPEYFSRLFKAEYGMTPKGYARGDAE
ncbi:ATP-binding protein [Neolewinella persica]|uniref:ATP-binding protein n=1 Tax=Neolewinella persica TaxID=70998 RepID=UPI00037FCBE6|nr:ATP-binding protein [Neolewinella persica]